MRGPIVLGNAVEAIDGQRLLRRQSLANEASPKHGQEFTFKSKNSKYFEINTIHLENFEVGIVDSRTI